MDSTERILLAIGDLKGELGEFRAEGKGRDERLREMKELLAKHVEDDNKVAKRVSVLEHARSRATGYVLALSAVGGIATTAGVAIAKALL